MKCDVFIQINSLVISQKGKEKLVAFFHCIGDLIFKEQLIFCQAAAGSRNSSGKVSCPGQLVKSQLFLKVSKEVRSNS